MKTLIQTALDAAEAATAIHLQYTSRVDVEGAQEKGYSDFVSFVDLEAQRAALQVIRERHPDHRILAEEEDGERADDAPTSMEGPPLWIVDPLDGTTNYLHGHPFYAVSVGVVVDGDFSVGVVGQASTGERWWACRGEGAWKGESRMRVSEARKLERSLIGTGFPFKVLDLLPGYLQDFDRVLRSTSGIRRTGAAALDLCYLAEGRLDGFWEAYLSPWDVAAGIAILREAGGVATRPDGSPIDLAPGPVLAANSQALHGALGSLLGEKGSE
jgi:myo-inositol-1(or 4)-monophosphatase